MIELTLDQNDCLIVQFDILSDNPLHPLWLRERLSGEKYIDQNNLQRLYEPSLIDENLKIKDYYIKDQDLYLEFSDGAKGQFNINDIIKEISKTDVIPKKKTWKNNFNSLPTHNFENVLSNNKYLMQLLDDFQMYGFVLVTHLSKEEGTVIKFAEHFGPVRSTNFGKHFDVVSKPKANDLAYTNLGITAHTDNPYRKPIPGIQILHCIANDAKGGDSSLVDGFAVSEHLKFHYSEYYKILTETEILFKFTDKDVILENWGKLIELDNAKNFKQIRFSGRLDFVPCLQSQELKKFYKARNKLYHLYKSDEFKINFRLESGMLMMFDNHRILHGRTEYDLSTGHRHLQGCYIEHDSTEGKLRLLKKKMS